MADQFTQPTAIQRRIAAFPPVDHRQVARERLGTPPIERSQRVSADKALEIIVIAGSIDPLREHEKFARLGNGKQLLAGGKGPDVKRLHMAGQTAIRLVIP